MNIRGVASAPGREVSFRAACDSLDTALTGPARQAILGEVSRARTFDRAVRHLRECMRGHGFEAGGVSLFAGRWVKHFEHVTREDGFHILHDWDGKGASVQ